MISDVSLRAAPGSVIAIIGGNGSGKSTILRAIIGQSDVFAGVIGVDGIQVDASVDVTRRVRELRIDFVPQKNATFGELTVEENLKISGRALGLADPVTAIDRALEVFEPLKGKRGQRVASLSGGERQMVALADALMRRPHVLLLDEPAAGLSSNVTRLVFDAIGEYARSENAAVLIVEHGLKSLRGVVTTLYVLRRGIVSYAGGPELLDFQSDLAAVFL